jgi:peptide/nickel transport system substrate-binding protein
VQVVEGPELRTIYLGFDHEREQLLYSDVQGRNPLKDRRVREAIYRAIDADGLVRRRDARQGLAGRDDGEPLPHRRAGRPERAPALRPGGRAAPVGGGGVSERLLGRHRLPNDRYVNDERTCQAVAAMLARVGIRLQVQSEPTGVWSRRTANRDFSMFMLGHAGCRSPTATRR